jgi:hypothetical protein
VAPTPVVAKKPATSRREQLVRQFAEEAKNAPAPPPHQPLRKSTRAFGAGLVTIAGDAKEPQRQLIRRRGDQASGPAPGTKATEPARENPSVTAAAALSSIIYSGFDDDKPAPLRDRNANSVAPHPGPPQPPVVAVSVKSPPPRAVYPTGPLDDDLVDYEAPLPDEDPTYGSSDTATVAVAPVEPVPPPAVAAETDNADPVEFGDE